MQVTLASAIQENFWKTPKEESHITQIKSYPSNKDSIQTNQDKK